MESGPGPALRIRDVTFAAIDFESAGAVRGATDVPVQIGIAMLRDATRIDSAEFYVSYLAADRAVTWDARRVHGISDADLIGAPTMLRLWPDVSKRLSGNLIVSHGAGTERRYLRAFPGHGFGPWVDTLTLARKFAPGCESYSLSALVIVFGLEAECFDLIPNFRWHDALCDAVASLVLLREFIRRGELTDADASILCV